MKYRNKYRKSVVVEVLDMSAEYRLGEMKSVAVVYRKVGSERLCCRLKPEFLKYFEVCE